MSTSQVAEPGVLTPLGRLEALCDRDSLELIRTGVINERMGARARPDDGVVTGAGRIAGRPVFCYAQDPSYLGGSLGAVHAQSIIRLMDMAERRGAPVVGFVESGGARLQEGQASLAGYAEIFRRSIQLSKVVPQVTVVTGVSAGGGAYSPDLTDFVLMTGAGRMFLTGPRVVEAVLGEKISIEDLGGPRVQRGNGVADMTLDSDADAIAAVQALLGLLPQRIGQQPPLAPPLPPTGADPSATVPAEARKVYDIRDVIGALADGGDMLELSPRWAGNMVTALCRIDGHSMAVLANQPRRLGGVIDARGAEKASRFIDRCDRFGLPLLVLVDTPGFMPGQRQEAAGVIRYGAGLLRAFAAATVPKVTVVVRKAYGGAAITMNSRGLGADLVLAWPGAEIGIMAAAPAIEIIHGRTLADQPPAARAEMVAAYTEEHLSSSAGAATGWIDEVIEPKATRDRIASAMGWLEGR